MTPTKVWISVTYPRMSLGAERTQDPQTNDFGKSLQKKEKLHIQMMRRAWEAPLRKRWKIPRAHTRARISYKMNKLLGGKWEFPQKRIKGKSFTKEEFHAWKEEKPKGRRDDAKGETLLKQQELTCNKGVHGAKYGQQWCWPLKGSWSKESQEKQKS